jgi:hypothetical protein
MDSKQIVQHRSGTLDPEHLSMLREFNNNRPVANRQPMRPDGHDLKIVEGL